MLNRYDQDGSLAGTVRETFAPFARRLSADQRIRDLVLDAYTWCYAKRSQAAMVRDEHRLILGSLDEIRRRRGARPLPDIPVVVFSATTGRPEPERQMWTGLHADLAASVPRGRHIVLAGASHAINQERFAEIAEAVSLMVQSARR